MLWFKHYTNARRDPFIVSLEDRFGDAGYKTWFGLIEIICEQTGRDLDKKFECEPIYLKRELRKSVAKLREILEFCQAKGKVSVQFEKDLWCFYFPKIAEIKDNYTKDLQGSSKTLAKEEKREEENKNKKKSKIEEVRHIYGEYKKVRLTDKQLGTLKTEFPNDWQQRIENLDSYMESTDKPYKNCLATIRNWARRDKKKEVKDNGTQKYIDAGLIKGSDS